MFSKHITKHFLQVTAPDCTLLFYFRDFMQYFGEVEICHLTPESAEGEDGTASQRRFEVFHFDGRWRRGRDQLYKNRSSRKIDSRRLLSREYDFPETFSLTENKFSGKTYFYTIRPWFCSSWLDPVELRLSCEVAGLRRASMAGLMGSRQREAP